MTKAYNVFLTTFKRSVDLILLYDRLRKVRFKKDPKRLSHDELSDLLRSAVVLGVSSMDMYFTDLFVEFLIPYLRKKGPTPPLVKFLEEAGLGAEAALDMVTMKRPYRRIRSIVEAYLDDYTTQREDIVNGLFKPYGIKNICGKAETKAKRKTLLKRIKKLTDRRHQIAHKGDLNNYNKPRRIGRDDIEKLLQELNLFIESFDKVFVETLKL